MKPKLERLALSLLSLAVKAAASAAGIKTVTLLADWLYRTLTP
jgi:hypothetical protein